MVFRDAMARSRSASAPTTTAPVSDNDPSQALTTVERGRVGPLKILRSKFGDPETGETLGKDIVAAVADTFNFITPKEARKYFKAKYGAYALFTEAVSIVRDSCYEDDLLKRLAMLRLAVRIFEQSRTDAWETVGTVDSRQKLDDVTRSFIRATMEHLNAVHDDILKDLALSSQKPISLKEIEEMMEDIRERRTPKNRLLLKDKLRQKRVQMLEYLFYAGGLGTASGGLFYLSSTSHGIVQTATYALSGSALLGSMHPLYKARIEYIKMKAAAMVLYKKYGVKGPELNKKDKAKIDEEIRAETGVITIS